MRGPLGSGGDGQILVAVHDLRRQASVVDGLSLTQHCSVHLGRAGAKWMGSAPTPSYVHMQAPIAADHVSVSTRQRGADQR